MEISDSSSEDECNIYVNAASKLNALNRRAKFRIKDHEDSDDDDDIVCTTKRDSPIINGNKVNHENTNIDCAVEDSEEDPEQSESSNGDTSEDDVVVSLEISDSPSSRKTRSTRTTRNSNKTDTITPTVVEPPIVINDTIDQDLNLSYDDSLQLSQDENDSYVIIGSPPPAKKNENSDNHEVSVKVMWKSNKVERFDVRRYETFQKIFKYFANLESVHEDQILIMKKDKRITPFDTPMSINLSIIDILDGGVVSAAIAKKNKKGAQAEELENACKIKIQTSDKQTLTVTLKHDQTFAALVHNCSEQLGIPEAKMKFYFDGELIDIDETPKSLDIDDEACFDLKISK